MRRLARFCLWFSIVVLLHAGCSSSADDQRPRRARQSVTSSTAAEDAGVTIHDSPQSQPDWAVPYGSAFWEASETADRSTDGATGGELDLHRVIRRVESAFEQTDEGAVQVDHRAHRTALQGNLLIVEPKLPGQTDAPQARADIETTAVDCGATSANIDRGADWLVTGNTAQRRLAERLGAVEHVGVGPTGPEVTWRFGSRALEDCDDLTIRTRLTGLAYKTTTSEGVHFADATGQARLRVSHATVVDADGNRWNRRVEHIGDGTLRVALSRQLLARASAPLAIDPVFEAEEALDSPVDTARNVEPDIIRTASNGNHTLVAWAKVATTAGGTDQLEAARLKNKGNLLDPSGVGFDSSTADYGPVAVASDGTNYLIAWEDYRAGNSNIYGTRVDQNGKLVDGAAGKVLADNSSYDFTEPTLAFDGTNYLLAWRDERGGSYDEDIYGVRLDTSAARVDATDLEIGAASDKQSVPRAASNGSSFLVVWQDDRAPLSTDVYAARVTSTGSLPDSPDGVKVQSSADHNETPDVASDGSGYLITWSYRGADIYGATVSISSGTTSIASPFVINDETSWQTTPSVTFGSSKYLVVWADERHSSGTGDKTIYGTRVGSSGGVSSPSGFAVTDANALEERIPSVAFNGTDFLVAWHFRTDREPTQPLYATRVSTASNVRDPDGILLNPTDNSQRDVAVAHDGSRYFVAWEDDREPNNGTGIYGLRVDNSGTPVSTTATEIADATASEQFPRVATNGSNFFIVWNAGVLGSIKVELQGKRLEGATGTLLDTQPITITQDGDETRGSYDVVSNGSGYLVGWREPNYHLTAARVSGTGTVQDPNGIDVTSVADAEHSPAVASDGTDYLIAWEEGRYPRDDQDIYAARLRASDGKVLDTPEGFPISEKSGDQHNLAAAFGAGNYRLLWDDARHSTTGAEIYTVEVSTGGSVRSSTERRVTDNSTSDVRPAITWDGRLFTFVWERSGTIRGARIDGFGTLLDKPSGSGSFEVHDGYRPMIDAQGKSAYLVGYHRTDASLETDRGYVRKFSLDGDGDGALDHADNCRGLKNASQDNADGDQWGDACDSCPNTAGPTCTIDGTSCIASGDKNPNDPCEECQPSVSKDSWTIDASNSCDDGDVCTTGDSCDSSGSCQSGSPRDCSHLDSACQTGVCTQSAGGCTTTPKGDTSISCDDGDPCTINDHCDGSGGCTGGGSKDCSHLESACKSGICTQSAGGCTTTPKGDTSLGCDDGDPCTVDDHCDGAGSCTGGDARDCSDLDGPCQNGVCRQSAGGCTTEAKPDGTACGDDRSCDSGTVTLQDTCQNGTCQDEGTEDCNPYATCADATTCTSSCDDASECTGSLVCRNSACEQNSAPTADAGDDQTVTADTQVTLDATGSSDPDGDSLTYTWSQSAGPDVSIDESTATPTFRAPTEDLPVTLQFELVVHDGFTDSSPDTVALTVEPPPNEAPTAAAGDDQVVNESGEVTLDGSNSRDPDGDSLSYEWRQTQGPPVTLDDATAIQPTFTAPEVDASTELVFELEVDDGDATDTDTVGVTVDPEPNDDTGLEDAGVRDAGRTDAEPGTSDAGEAEDTVVTIAPSQTDDGCNCATDRPAPPAGGTLLAALFGLVGLIARRRRH